MEIRVQHEEGHTVAFLTGELTGATRDDLAVSLRPLVDGDVRRLLVDLSGVKFIDSSGLGCLVDLYARANTHDCHMVLVNPSPFVAGVLDHTRLNRWFEICASVDEAVRRAD